MSQTSGLEGFVRRCSTVTGKGNEEKCQEIECAYNHQHVNLTQSCIDKDLTTTARILKNQSVKSWVDKLLPTKLLKRCKYSLNAIQTTTLCAACLHGTGVQVRLLLRACADANIRDSDGKTPLSWACLSEIDRLQKIQQLVMHCSSLDACDEKYKRTALHALVLARSMPTSSELRTIVGLFVKYKANINAKADGGKTALHLAVIHDRLDFLNVFMENGGDINDGDNIGFTPLHYAAKNGNEKAIQKLYRLNADSNVKSNSGYTPLDIARFHSSLECIELLTIFGAKKNERINKYKTPLHVAIEKHQDDLFEFLVSSSDALNDTDKEGNSAMHKLALSRTDSTSLHSAINKFLFFKHPHWKIELLHRRGGNIDSQNRQKETPLHKAVTIGNESAVDTLLALKADINISDSDGSTPLHLATVCGRKSLVEKLLNNGANINAKDNKGNTALYIAVYPDTEESMCCIRLLLKNANVDVNAQNSSKSTPLHLACKYSRTKIVKLLHKRGADLNLKGHNGYAPILIATHYNHAFCVHKLAKYGADVDITNENGDTSLHIASFYGYTDVMSVLFMHGANVNTANQRGLTPLHLAVIRVQKNSVHLLTSHPLCDLLIKDKNGRTALVMAYFRQTDSDTEENQEDWSREIKEVLIQDVVPQLHQHHQTLRNHLQEKPMAAKFMV